MPDRPLPFPLPVVPPRFTPLTAGAQNRKLASKLYADFFAWPIERSRKIIETTPPEVWEREGQHRALQVFHAAAERVPAYKDFLKKQKVNHEKVRTITDFRKVVPLMDKENYLRKYPLADLCWDGILASTQITSVSSGSSGEPFFWPRGTLLEIEITYLFELVLEALGATGRSTLVVDAFAMGMYVGGPFTLNATLRVAQKGHPIEVVTPGYALEEILRVVSSLGKEFSQVILASYPPFAKMILDEGIERGIDWARMRMHFLLAGEGFNETWRDYVAELAGGADPLRDFVSLYGTADAAVLGFESPFTISLRRVLGRDSSRQKKVFGEERLPAVLHYIPTLRYFEPGQRDLFFTVGTAGVPLVRYNIHDYGGVVSKSDLQQQLSRSENNHGLSARNGLPVIYLFGRSDFTSILHGANIYPENVRLALEDPGMRKLVTGRFTMLTETDRKQDQYLLINVECAANARPSLSLGRKVRRSIIDTLLGVNSEYRVVARAVGRKARPRVRLVKKGDPRHFGMGIKHKWKKGS